MVRGGWSVDDVARWQRLLGGRRWPRFGFKTARCRPGGRCSRPCARGADRCPCAHSKEELAYFRAFVDCRFGSRCRARSCWFRHPGEPTPPEEVEMRGIDVRAEVERRESDAGGAAVWGRGERSGGMDGQGSGGMDKHGSGGMDKHGSGERAFAPSAAAPRTDGRGRLEGPPPPSPPPEWRDRGSSRSGEPGFLRSRARQEQGREEGDWHEDAGAWSPGRQCPLKRRQVDGEGSSLDPGSSSAALSPNSCDFGPASPQCATSLPEPALSPPFESPTLDWNSGSGAECDGAVWDSRSSTVSEAPGLGSVPAFDGLNAQEEPAVLETQTAVVGTSCDARGEHIVLKRGYDTSGDKTIWCAVCACSISGPTNVDGHIDAKEHRSRLAMHKDRVSDCSKDCFATLDACDLLPPRGRCEPPREFKNDVEPTSAQATGQPTTKAPSVVPTALTPEEEDWLDQPMTLEDWRQMEKMADAKGPASALAFKTLRDTLLDTGGVTDDDLRCLTRAHTRTRVPFRKDARTGDLVLPCDKVPTAEHAVSEEQRAALTRVHDMLLTSVEPFANSPDDEDDSRISHGNFGRLHGHDVSISMQLRDGEWVCNPPGGGLRLACMHERSTMVDPLWKRLIPWELADMIDRRWT